MKQFFPTKKASSLFFLLLFCYLFAFPQKNIIIKGSATDSATNISLAAVSIKIIKQGGMFITNELGRFSFSVDSLPSVLVFSYIGYKTDTVKIVSYNQELTIKLQQLKNELPEVVIGEEAPFLISMAIDKGYKNWNKTQFSKAFYRQFDKEGDRLTTFKEILLDIKWFPGAVSAINVEGARYAEGDKGNVAIEMSNFSHYSYLFSGYIFSKEWAHFMTPLTKDSRGHYTYRVEKIIEQNNDEVAVIRCTPINKDNGISYFNGNIYIGKTGFDVYKIDGFFEDLGLNPTSSGIVHPKIKDDILKIEVNFKPGNDSFFVFSNSTQHLSFKVKYGLITLQKADIKSQLISYNDNSTNNLSLLKYTPLTLNLAATNDLKIARDATYYDPAKWINNPIIVYTIEEEELIKRLEKEKKIKGTYFQLSK